MTHPDDQLAAYEDGALADGERADLERHLATCARCREEIDLARAARAALAAVPDVDAPGTIGARAIAKAGGRSKTGAPTWYRWGGIAAGVAAAIVAAAILLPNVGSGGENREAAAPAAATDAPAPRPAGPVEAATTIERQDTDYDAMSVQELARSYSGTAFAVAERSPADAANGSTDFGVAAACLGHAAAGDEGTLIRLIQARFQGTPAYLGIYLAGPGAGQPTDAVRVLVVPLGDCSRILSSTWAKL